MSVWQTSPSEHRVTPDASLLQLRWPGCPAFRLAMLPLPALPPFGIAKTVPSARQAAPLLQRVSPVDESVKQVIPLLQRVNPCLSV